MEKDTTFITVPHLWRLQVIFKKYVPQRWWCLIFSCYFEYVTDYCICVCCFPGYVKCFCCFSLQIFKYFSTFAGVYMCECDYYISTHTHMYGCTQTSADTHACMHTHTYIHIELLAHMHAHTHGHVYMHVQTSTHTHTHSPPPPPPILPAHTPTPNSNTFWVDQCLKHIHNCNHF